jgi:hypothetical protein
MREIHCPEISFTENKREKRNNGITGEGITAVPKILPQIPRHKKHRLLNTASSLPFRLNTHTGCREGTGLYLSHTKLHYKHIRTD